MFVTTHTEAGVQHVHVTVERGFRAGTWEVLYEPKGPAWRVRSPGGREAVLAATEPWVGELSAEFEGVLRQIARRAVAEALRREGSLTSARGEVPAVRAVA